MNRVDPIILRELPAIQQIIRDETWLESERRGRSVATDDPAVCENVCAIILRVGARWRTLFATPIGPPATPVVAPPTTITFPPSLSVRNRWLPVHRC